MGPLQAIAPEPSEARRSQRHATSATPHQPLRITGSHGHLHAYWTLTEPVSVLVAEQANRRLAAQLGADQSSVTNAATVLRPPGTCNFKTTPAAPVVLEHCSTPATSTLQAVTAGIAEDPTPPAAAPRSRPPAAGRGQDPLRALDPAHYVSVLTGQTVGRSRKITCPFHEDRTPSLDVYETSCVNPGCVGGVVG